MPSGKNDPAKPTGKRSLAIGGAIAALVATGGLGYLVLRGKSTPPPAPATTTSAASPEMPPAPLKRKRKRRTPNREQLEKSLETYEKARRYPPTSRPMSDVSSDRRSLTASPPAVRSTVTDSGHKVELSESQDRKYVADGESAIAKVKILVDGKPAADVTTSPASLAKIEGTPRTASAPVETVEFHDDGRDPDERAGDGIFAAVVPFTAEKMGNFAGDAQLTADFHLGTELFSSVFGFVDTGPAPAHFTEHVRESVDDGSLVLHVGIDVDREGPYVVYGRLYDAQGLGIVFMDGSTTLKTTDHEVKLVAFGALLRDIAAKSPFSLRDVEAYRTTDGEDRQEVPAWVGPYKTRAYRVSEFSSRPFTSPENDPELQTLKAAVEAAPQGSSQVTTP